MAKSLFRDDDGNDSSKPSMANKNTSNEDISGRIMRSLQTMRDTLPNMPTYTSNVKKPSSVSLRMQKKNTLCVILLTAASLKFQIG